MREDLQHRALAKELGWAEELHVHDKERATETPHFPLTFRKGDTKTVAGEGLEATIFIQIIRSVTRRAENLLVAA